MHINVCMYTSISLQKIKPRMFAWSNGAFVLKRGSNLFAGRICAASTATTRVFDQIVEAQVQGRRRETSNSEMYGRTRSPAAEDVSGLAIVLLWRCAGVTVVGLQAPWGYSVA